MALSGISGMAGGGQQSAKDARGIADNFDAFLLLLTTQLQNQNPLDPLDTNEFTQQLVQFAGVEQSIRTNENLENLANISAANVAAATANFIGKKVTVGSTRTDLKDGEAEWTYNAGSGAESAKFTIRDDAGNVVWQEEQSISAGRTAFVWDGRTTDGSTAPEGTYQLTVEAKDGDGETVSVDVEVSARIDGIDYSGDEPVLLAGDRRIPLSELRSVVD